MHNGVKLARATRTPYHPVTVIVIQASQQDGYEDESNCLLFGFCPKPKTYIQPLEWNVFLVSQQLVLSIFRPKP